ncbi:MAG: PilZ domain-containing protein [Rhodanobacteraceae bacterium]
MNADSGVKARYARKPLCSTVLMNRGGDSWFADTQDISATGMLVDRPRTWAGAVGDLFVLDLLIGEDFCLHMEATVARLTSDQIGFAYARIPENKEIPLWRLLGAYADRIEPDCVKAGSLLKSKRFC